MEKWPPCSLRLPACLALRDQREGAQVGEADLDRLQLHVEEGRAIQHLVAGADLAACLVELPTQSAMKWPSPWALWSNCPVSAAAHPPQKPCPITMISPTLICVTANSSAEETPWWPPLPS